MDILELVEKTLAEALLRGLPINYKIIDYNKTVKINYRGREALYQVNTLVDPLSGVETAISISTLGSRGGIPVVERVGSREWHYLPENIVVAIGQYEYVMAVHEVDTWANRLKKLPTLPLLENPPRVFQQLKNRGFRVYIDETTMDYAVVKKRAVAFWYNEFFSVIDTAYREQLRQGVVEWSSSDIEAIEGVVKSLSTRET